MAGKVNPVQSYQEATNQLLKINAQRRSNLAEAKAEEMVEAARNNILAQSAEFVSSQSQTNGPVDAALNPATQNILGQYGLGQPKVQKTSSSSQQVTKQNIVINNKNTTVTNNNVHVPANIGGPVQGRPVQFQDQNQIKFKSWLSNSFAQQNELAEKRKRDYEKRDMSLVKSANKLMRKLEETGKSVASSLNPKNMASSMSNQFKTLMLVLGIGYMAKHWPEILEKVTSIEKKVTDFFSEGGSLVKMLGGKKDESVFDAFKNLFIDKDDGILSYVKKWIGDKVSERKAAIKNVQKPNFNVGDAFKPGEALSKIVNYLGDILGAIVDPTGNASKVVSEKANNFSEKYISDNNSSLRKSIGRQEMIGGEAKSISSGDAALLRGEYKGLTNTSLDKNGNLTGTPGSTVAQGLELERALISSKTGNLQTSAIASGLNRLYNTANKDGSVTLSKDFLISSIGEAGIKELGLKPSKYSYVARPKTAEELAFDLARVGALIGSAGYGLGELIKKAREKKIPEYTVDIREGDNPELSEGEKKLEWTTPTDVYKVSKEDLQKIIDKISGLDGYAPDINSHEFMTSLESSLMGKVQKGNKIKKDADMSSLYEPNKLAEQHDQERKKMWNNNRGNMAWSNTKATFQGVANKFGFSNFTFTPDETYNNIDSGDVGKKAAYIANHSTQFIGNGQVRDLGREKYKGLCTAGPATFYEQAGLEGIRNKFWEKGKSYYNSTSTGLKDLGFKMVWHGTKEQGHNTNTLKQSGYTPQPGDILFNFATGLEATSKHPGGNSGHAQMWDGSEWVSDTRQGQRSWAYNLQNSKGRVYDYSVQAWRYDSQNPKKAEVDVDNSNPIDEFTGIENYESEDLMNNPANPYESIFYNNGATKAYQGFAATPQEPTYDFNNMATTSDYTATPESSLPEDHTSAFSETSPDGGGSNFTDSDKQDFIDYTACMNELNINLQNIRDLITIGNQTDIQELNMTSGIVSAINNLKNNNTPQVPFAFNYTNSYDQQRLNT